MWVYLLSVFSLADAATPNFWPLPQNYSMGSTKLWLPSDFQFIPQPAAPGQSPLDTAFATYTSIIFPTKSFPEGPAATKLPSLIVAVADYAVALQLGADESYQLTIKDGSPSATLTAKTVWGALRGLELFAQAVSPAKSSAAPGVLTLSVSDKPRFQWRGLLIDTSRSFITVPIIKDVIEAMSFIKLNVLHWHATDTQSFPIYNDAYPELTKGALGPNEVYSTADQQDVINYANARGIRVVLEMDVPGHALSWGKGIPSIVVTDCPAYSHNINNIPLDPTQSLTLEVVTKLYADRAKVFPDQFFHLGGDEVVFGCWENNSAIMKWMRQHGMSQGVELERWWEAQVLTAVQGMSRHPIVWVEIFENGNKLPTGSVVQCWKDNSVWYDVMKAGLYALVSHGWYLSDPGTWQQDYVIDPFDGTTTPSPDQLRLGLGGEAAVWGPVSGTVPPVMMTAFPRLLAVAERLWSARSVNDPQAAESRYDWMWCQLISRGVPVPGRSCAF